MIAEVIVDVSAYPIDKPFDYLIPSEMTLIIERGIRVKVPFGNRKLLGFVINIKEDTDFPIDKMKPIEEVLDLTPVLTDEMLNMAKWMKDHTLCFEIDALFAMLPSALRAKYDKTAHIIDRSKIRDSEIESLFNGKESISLKNITSLKTLSLLKEYSLEKIVEIETVVKQKTAIKKVRTIQIIDDESLLTSIVEGLSGNAKKAT